MPLFYSIKSRVRYTEEQSLSERSQNVLLEGYRWRIHTDMAVRMDEIHCVVVFDWTILRANIRRDRKTIIASIIIRHQIDDDVAHTEPSRGGGEGSLRSGRKF